MCTLAHLVSRFSALQRAENSSIAGVASSCNSRSPFQCSSASRKFLNAAAPPSSRLAPRRFQCSSASRKFLNVDENADPALDVMFQCSSASRKFLNVKEFVALMSNPREFQCSSASRKFLNPTTTTKCTTRSPVSVLFSEPKIPQFPDGNAVGRDEDEVSVLFSEPKIPQCDTTDKQKPRQRVSVLFSEPKIPQYTYYTTHRTACQVSVLFSEPKIPQFIYDVDGKLGYVAFQCSSASRKFLNVRCL